MLYRGDEGETFCLAVAEAQALGVPAVVQPLGAVAERVIDGVTGTVARDDEALRRAPRSRSSATTRCGAASTRRRWRGRRALSWDEAAAALRGAGRVTRLLQAMAGQASWRRRGVLRAARHRARTAPARTQRLVIRRDAARAARLRQAGCEVVELPFGGRLDFAHAARALRRAIAEFRAAGGADLDEPRDAALSRAAISCMWRGSAAITISNIIAAAITSIANTRDIADYIVRARLARGARPLSAEFRRATSARAGCRARASRRPRTRRSPWRSAGSIATRASMCCSRRWRWCRRSISGSPARARSAQALERRAAGARHRRARALPRLARRRGGAARGVRHAGLVLAPRAAGQCRDRGLGGRRAGGRRRRAKGRAR